MNVIVVSKTHMQHGVCVGGILADGRPVRLLDEHGDCQPGNTRLKPGDVYSISFIERHKKVPPHVEDVAVTSWKYVSSYDIKELADVLLNGMKVKVWRGNINMIFDGKLQWTPMGIGYICRMGGIPECSAGFWIADQDLKKRDNNGVVKYSYQYDPAAESGSVIFHMLRWKHIKFVGFQQPLDIIRQGTLIRVSLARWWIPEDRAAEERCYLQLSGWYEI